MKSLKNNERKISKLRLTELLTIGTIVAAVPSLAQTYTLQDLGTLPGSTVSQGYALNDLGQACGVSGSLATATLFSDGQAFDLGGFVSGDVTVATGINKDTVVVGWERFASIATSHALIWSNGGIQDIHSPSLFPGGTEATAINSSGLVIGLAAPALAQTSGTWTKTGSMNCTRQYHTLTLLPNGEVLAAGGGSISAELYNPAAGTWTVTGSMNTDRQLHTATLLGDGKVLIAGGLDNVGFLSSAELYDPATGEWSVTGSLNGPRYGATATMLPGGQVLVAGGNDGTGNIATAELYNPATGTWSKTGNMSTARQAQTMTLLPDGKVLAAGGDSTTAILSSAELYDPATGKWSVTGSMNSARESHKAALLLNGQVLAAGGVGSSGSLFSTELYNPATGKWVFTGTMLNNPVGFTATLLPTGKVLVAAGVINRYPSAHTSGVSELYDPSTGSWATTGAMNTSRALAQAILLQDGEVLVAGGQNFSRTVKLNYLSSAELYTP